MRCRTLPFGKANRCHTTICLVGNSHIRHCSHGRLLCERIHPGPADGAERSVLRSVLWIVLLFDLPVCCNAERKPRIYCFCRNQMRVLQPCRRFGWIYRSAFQRASEAESTYITLIKRTRAFALVLFIRSTE